MGYQQHANWIDGRPHDGCSSGFYALTDPLHPAQTLGAWPRSVAEDVALALAQLDARASRGAPSRRERVRLADRIDAGMVAARKAAGGDKLCADLLALGEAGLLETDEFLELELERGIVLGMRDEPRTDHTTLLRCHWSELLSGLGSELARRLVRGERVLLLSEPRLPRAADLFAQALFEAGLAPWRLAVLHDDGLTVLRAAVEQGGLDEIVVSGHGHEEQAVRSALGTDDSRLLFHCLSRGSLEICLGDDPVERAAHIVEEAFGRRTTLGGQLPGQVGLVTCPIRHFSAFSAALLAELERCGEPRPSVPFLDEDLGPWLRRALELGLDEGATLIHGAGSSASPCTRSNARLGPLVFTNVEPHMRLVALTRPAPLLLLMRSAS